MKKDKVSVLFVCMGNICRSPAGEGVFQSMVEQAGLAEQIEIDSAGTLGFHQGEPADARMRAAAGKRGYRLASKARQISEQDLATFDLILTMDQDNQHNVLALAADTEQGSRVIPFCEFCREHDADSVPDPYYGGAQGFEIVLDLLEDGCRGLLAEVESRLG